MLEEDRVKFCQALKSEEIEKSVWMYIMSIDPWFRPRGERQGELLLWDKNGPGVWLVKGTREARLNIMNNRELGLDDDALLKENGIYYPTSECAPCSRSSHETKHLNLTDSC